jgi:hypothetical protein
MFRGSQCPSTTIPVQISTATGDSLRGYIKAGITGKLVDFLNRETGFFEFIGADGQAIILSKSAVRSVAVIEQPRTDQLSRRMKLQDTLDSYAVLGVSHGANAEEVRNAYRHGARLYHPDNLAGVQVPDEVLEYITAVFRRLTDAYREICKPEDVGEAA